jgi:ribose transport system substrate-binding protein
VKRPKQIIALVATATIAALTLAACSSSGGTNGNAKPNTNANTNSGSSAAGATSGSASAAGGSSSFMARATQLSAQASTPKPATAPSSGPKAAQGKSLILIPCASNDLACQTEVNLVKTTAGKLGWKSLIINPAGDPTKMSSAVGQAVSNKASGVFTVAIDAATIQNALTQAKNAGLKLGCFACVNTNDLYNFTFPTNEDYVHDGYNLAAKAFVDSGGHLRAIVIKDDEFAAAKLREQGILNFISDCRKAGADCKTLATTNILIANISTTVPQQIVSVTRANPTWNALFTPYDGAFVYIIPALAQAGVKADQRGYGFDPVQQDLNWIKTGHIEAAAVAAPFQTIAYASVDELNRLFQGQPMAKEQVLDKLIDGQNLPAAGQLYLGDGNPSAGYSNLWGVK